MSREWQKFVEHDAVLAGNDAPSPVWNRNIPRCHDSCVYHDGKRCELIGIRAPEMCEPVAEALGNLVEERWEKIKWAASILEVRHA